jgi:hypothetical protein
MTSELPVTVDILRAALTSPTVQSPASATALYEALELEMGFHKFRGAFIVSTFPLLSPTNHTQSIVFGTGKFQPPAIRNEDPPPPHRTLREVMSGKKGEEFAEEYYLRRTLTSSFEVPPRVSLPSVVHGSTNTGTVRESMSRNFLDYSQTTPIPSPRPLHITVDMLAIALRSLGLENEIPAIDFFHILEMELRERGIFSDVGGAPIIYTSPASTQSQTQ